MSAIPWIKRRWSSGDSKKMSPHARIPSKIRSKNVESWTASQITGVFGRLRRNAWTQDGAASMAKTSSPSATSISVRGKPGPQPRSITAAPLGNVRAHCRTASTPTPVERPLPRRARYSTATPSYPFDRSILDSLYQSGLLVGRMLTICQALVLCPASVLPIADEVLKCSKQVPGGTGHIGVLRRQHPAVGVQRSSFSY